jgi:hypothetical protein
MVDPSGSRWMEAPLPGAWQRFLFRRRTAPRLPLTGVPGGALAARAAASAAWLLSTPMLWL